MVANGDLWQASASGCSEGGAVALSLSSPFGSGDPACAPVFQGSQAPDVGIAMGFSNVCNIYSAAGYHIGVTQAVTIKSFSLGQRSAEAGDAFVVRFGAPDGGALEVAVGGVPAEQIGSWAFNLPGHGFPVLPGQAGFTIEFTGATSAAGTAYLKTLSTQRCGGSGQTCEGDSDCCSDSHFCAGPAYPPQCAACRAEGDPCGGDAECCQAVPYCSQGVCAACKAAGDACGAYAECCGYCDRADDTCKECRGPDEECTDSTQCCADPGYSYCTSGRCSP